MRAATGAEFVGLRLRKLVEKNRDLHRANEQLTLAKENLGTDQCATRIT